MECCYVIFSLCVSEVRDKMSVKLGLSDFVMWNVDGISVSLATQ